MKFQGKQYTVEFKVRSTTVHGGSILNVYEFTDYKMAAIMLRDAINEKYKSLEPIRYEGTSYCILTRARIHPNNKNKVIGQIRDYLLHEEM